MSSFVYPPAPLTRQQEKAELQHLNDKFSDYIVKVRKAREEANQIDSTSLLNAIKNLEEEVGVIKGLYERELEKLRRELEALGPEKQKFEVLAQKNGALATELQDRYSVEQQRSRGLQDELANLQQIVAKKDLENNRLRAENEDLANKLINLQKEYDGLLHDYEDVSRRLEKEQLARGEAQDSYANLQKKFDFQNQVHGEELAEMKSRLDDKGKQILLLEGRVRELSQADNTLHELLARVRDAAAAELKKYKEESEEQYAKNLHELRVQMDQDAANIARLADENKRLCGETEDYTREINSLQNKVRTLEHNNVDLTENLDQERQKSSVHIRALEDKLKEVQDTLIYKLQELGSGKEPPIRAEIESLKVLVEDEENKLRNLTRGSSAPMNVSVPPINTTGLSTSLTAQPRPPISFSQTARLTGSVPLGKYSNTTGMSTSITTRAPPRPASVPAPSSTMGQGRDYFDSMFGDLKKETLFYPKLHPKSSPPKFTATSHDYTTATASSTGPIKILEVNGDGKFVRLFNSSANHDEEFGGYMIQQNVGGHPVAVYRFPPRTRFRAGSTVTVWAAAGMGQHNPPTDFQWKEQHKWGTGPECTTILCKPTGQAIAWTTAAHRFTKNAISFDARSEDSSDAGESNPNPEIMVEVDGKPTTALRIEKEEQPLLVAAKHPHGLYTGDKPHPSTGASRVRSGGNDNSSYCRQTRSQNSRPVPDMLPYPGELYSGSGAGGTRLGSAPLRKSSAKMSIDNTRMSAEPSPFMSPHQQKYATVSKISSQHHVKFQPPMPRPPVVSSW